MPSLICDLSREAASRLPAYELLREAGEALLLYWPAAAQSEAGVRDAADAQGAWDDERLAVAAALPRDLDMADFERVLIIAAGQAPAEQELAAALLRAGAEAVEILPAAEADQLAQSWRSGRRTGRLLRGQPAG